MDRIRDQAAKLWQLLSSPQTAETYQSASSLTGTIFKELGILLWLLICLLLVVFDWAWHASFQAGYQVRSWINSFDSSRSEQLVPETGKALLEAGKNSLNFTINQAREQLGLPLNLQARQPEPEPIAAQPLKATETPKSIKLEPPQNVPPLGTKDPEV